MVGESDSSGSEYEPEAYCCEHGNEYSCSTKGGQFFYHLGDY
jgi:hypothetical protein